MLLTACRSPVEPGVQSGPQAHYGTVSITFDDGPARTIYPTKAFDAYVYTFTPAGGAAQVLTPVNGVFTLEAGNWNVRVDAYVGAVAPVNLAASGEANFTLDASENKAVSITLTANETSGAGTFSWHIIYPAGTTVETFTLRKLPGLTDVALTPQAGERTMTGAVADVPAGAYMLDIRLANDGLYAGANEVVYIYALLATEYGSLAKPVVFEGQDFLGVFTDLDDVAQYLDEHTGGTSAANSILLPLAYDLGNMPEIGSGWRNLLDVIEAAGKYVALDLSACTMDGTEFDPVYFVAAGKDKIVSLDLPDVAASIIGASGGNSGDGSSFDYFSSLTAVTAKYVLAIGNYAFDCYNNSVRNLTSVSFPAVTRIGTGAFAFCTSLTAVSFSASADVRKNPFYGCLNLTSITVFGAGPLSVIEDGKALVKNNTELVLYPSASGSITMNTITSIGEAFSCCNNLTSVFLPAAAYIGDWAFNGCINLISVSIPAATYIGDHAFSSTNLTSVSFPVAISIGDHAFEDCPSLESVSFPAATTVGDWAFNNCYSLTDVSIMAAISIGERAFRYCINLESVSFPAATTIGDWAFNACTSLISVSIPAAASIGSNAFRNTGTTALTVTLGATPPTLGTDIFFYVDIAKNVTVRFPAEGAAAYGSVPTDTVTQNWGNAFRGMGWDGTAYLYGTVNDNVNLTYVLIGAEDGLTFAYYWVNERDVIATASGAATAGGASGNAFVLPFGNSLTITANGSGYTNQRWFIDGVEDSGQAGNAAYVFTSAGKAPKRYTIGLIVEKGGKYYNVNFAVTVG
jgi:hypothetical protein